MLKKFALILPGILTIVTANAYQPDLSPEVIRQVTTSLPTLDLGKPLDASYTLTTLGDLLPTLSGRGPILIERSEVEYPEDARLAAEEGAVEVLVEIDEVGRVTHAEVFWSDTTEDLQDAALAAAEGFRFLPAEQWHVPVKCQAVIPFSFQLQ